MGITSRAYGAPPGLVAFFDRDTPPPGWLVADGQFVQVALYTALTNAIFVGTDAIVHATAVHGFRCDNPADPINTKNIAGAWLKLPDLRAEFLRGLDMGRNIPGAAGNVRARLYSDTMKAHGHAQRFVQTPAAGTNFNGTASSATVASAAGLTTGSATTADTGNDETRPRHLAMLPCIKF